MREIVEKENNRHVNENKGDKIRVFDILTFSPIRGRRTGTCGLLT